MKIKVFSASIILLFLVLLPRVFVAAGFPKVLVFLHFLITPILFVLIFKRALNSLELRPILVLTLMLFLVILFSMLINGSGIINMAISFLMITSPIMFLVMICSDDWSNKTIALFERIIFSFVVLHTLLSFFQYYILGFRDDDVEGVFMGMGAGGHMAGAISAISAVWLLKFRWLNTKIKYTFVVASIMVVFLSDSKQVIAVLSASVLIYFFVSAGSKYEKVKVVALFIVLVIILIILANTIAPSLLVYLQDDKIIDGLEQKLNVFPVILDFYEGWYSWLFGLGPGHSVSRLATMLPNYEFLVSSFGATSHEATWVVLLVKESQYLSNSVSGSSMFALDFSLAGIWGDVGILGFLVFISIYAGVWRIAKLSDGYSQFLVVSLFVYGFVFTWLEEPAFMFFVMAYIGYARQKAYERVGNESIASS